MGGDRVRRDFGSRASERKVYWSSPGGFWAMSSSSTDGGSSDPIGRGAATRATERAFSSSNTAALTGTVTLPGVTVEPAELRGMAAMLQAVGASVRTRLGAGPRMKAHLDQGAWARRPTTSSNGRIGDGSVASTRGVAVSSSHGYRAHDDGALASGELLPDLASLLEALGGPTPHPALTLAAECVVRMGGARGGDLGTTFINTFPQKKK